MVGQIQLKKPEVIRASADTVKSFRDLTGDITKAGWFGWKKKRRREPARYCRKVCFPIGLSDADQRESLKWVCNGVT